MRICGLVILLVAATLLGGCVERRLYIRSEPAGADVYIDGERVGVTRPDNDKRGPFYVNFAYYGTREYTLRKPGFAPTSGIVTLVTPWYEYPPVDFFAEVLAPWRIVSEHTVDARLKPLNPANVEDLYRDARSYRDGAQPQSRFEYSALWGKR